MAAMSQTLARAPGDTVGGGANDSPEARAGTYPVALARTVKQTSYILSALYEELRQLFEANLTWLKDPYST